ncbi:MAG: 4Fe-4S binding protein [Muribaculaceae bacterium]|nr:4Fe-4S binding protein [Muribaculaceae bacterium]
MTKKEKKKKDNGGRTFKSVAVNIFSLAVVFLIMSAAALVFSGKTFFLNTKESADHTLHPADTAMSDSTGVQTEEPVAEGFNGPVPVKVYFSAEGTVDSVEALPNSETPSYFEEVVNSGLLDAWDGRTAQEALALKVDAVSGATYSSSALITNVRSQLAAEVARRAARPVETDSSDPLPLQWWCALGVALLAAVLPMIWKNKIYRRTQEILNVAVLGFWSGTFVSYGTMLHMLSSGLSNAAALLTLFLFIIAFIYPLFGHPGYYCANVCPLGSLQELMNASQSKYKIKPGKKATKVLTVARYVLWGLLMILLWTGMLTAWINYELFAAFMVTKAAWFMIAAGIVILIISVFMPRPYCRFICPAGTLLRVAQNLRNA